MWLWAKIFLVPRLYTLYYIHPMTICILPVSTDNWSAFPEYFCQPSKFMTGEMVPLAMRTLNWQWELDVLSKWMTVDVCLVAVVECWPIVDTCGHYSHSKLCHLFHSASFLLLLPSPTPSQSFSPTPLLCCPTLMHSLKIVKKGLSQLSS